MSSERPQRKEPPEVDISEFAKVLATDVDKVRKKWNFLHKIYVTLHMFLVFAALVLSGGVVPYAAFYSMNATAFVSGLIVALIIGIQNAFAIGGKWAFYSNVLAELQALTFELRRTMSNSATLQNERLKQLKLTFRKGMVRNLLESLGEGFRKPLGGIGWGVTGPVYLRTATRIPRGTPLTTFLGGGPVPSVVVAGPCSRIAWRPAACTKRERVTHKLLW